jgi:hypothetical protein
MAEMSRTGPHAPSGPWKVERPIHVAKTDAATFAVTLWNIGQHRRWNDPPFNHGKSGDTNLNGQSRSWLLELYTRSLPSGREEKHSATEASAATAADCAVVYVG